MKGKKIIKKLSRKNALALCLALVMSFCMGISCVYAEDTLSSDPVSEESITESADITQDLQSATPRATYIEGTYMM